MPRTVGDLQNELDEIDNQLAEMVGAASIKIGSLSVDETKLMDDLTRRKASLEWRINNTNNGGSTSDTLSSGQAGGPY